MAADYKVSKKISTKLKWGKIAVNQILKRYLCSTQKVGLKQQKKKKKKDLMHLFRSVHYGQGNYSVFL